MLLAVVWVVVVVVQWRVVAVPLVYVLVLLDYFLFSRQRSFFLYL